MSGHLPVPVQQAPVPAQQVIACSLQPPPVQWRCSNLEGLKMTMMQSPETELAATVQVRGGDSADGSDVGGGGLGGR